VVYVGGEILASKKTSYAEQAGAGADESGSAVCGAAASDDDRGRQARRFDTEATKSTARPTMSQPLTRSDRRRAAAVPPLVIDEEKTLDQVIQSTTWRRKRRASDLELSLLNTTEFYAGSTGRACASRAKKSLSQNPIAAAAIEVKVISTIEPPRVIFRARPPPTAPGRRPREIPPFAEDRRHHHLAQSDRRPGANCDREEVAWRSS